LEYCTGGDLSTFLAQRKKITETDSLKIMNQVVEGYKYLIEQNILHRDLKPCNILKAGKYWKIADFGFATKKDQLDDINVGTPVYMPP
jgi:protein-serine/threonine kinase